MAFLAGIVASIGEWLLTNLFSWISKDIATAEQQSANQKQDQDEATALQNATTTQQVDDAAKNSLSNL